MKKFLFSGVFYPTDEVSEHQFKKQLKAMGPIQVDIDEIIIADEGIDDSYLPIWVYVSPDENDPYMLDDLEGRVDLADDELSKSEISDEMMIQIRNLGICTELVGYYPRADRYGYPGYVADTMRAEALAAFHKLIVTKEQFVSTGFDRGDDGAEQIWLKVMVPPQLCEKLKQLK